MNHNTIDYIEIPVKDLEKSKAFFHQVFGWKYTDYGDSYCSIDNAGIGAGMTQIDRSFDTARGTAFVVMYADHLEQKKQDVIDAGGKVTQDIFSFPGGRRFHFCDLNGNEYAVWCDK